MRYGRTTSFLSTLRAVGLMAVTAALIAVSICGSGRAEESEPYVIEVGDVTAKVGDHTVMTAKLRARDGYRVLQSYKNRVISLSSLDDGVAFDNGVVPATVEEGTLVFPVGLRPTKPGKHPINGIFRVGYIKGTDEFAMVSLRLIANVTGTE
jgi:hypothetical protein